MIDEEQLKKRIKDFILKLDVPLIIMLGAVLGYFTIGVIGAMICVFSDIFSIFAWITWLIPMLIGSIILMIAYLYKKYIYCKSEGISNRFNVFALIFGLMAYFSSVFTCCRIWSVLL